MPTRSPTRVMLRDELVGFARSKVMIVLWVVLPILAIAAYLLLPQEITRSRGLGGLSATAFVGFLMSSVAGTVAALMVAVDIVSERNRKVYELFVIRPIRRETIIWAKFLGVFACVTVACVVSLGLGIAVDAVRGRAPGGDELYDIVKSLVSLIGVIAMASAVGVVFGVMSRTILVAVILVLYVGQNLTIVPMLPVYLGWLPNQFWLIMLITAVLTGLLVYGASVMFRRSEL
ncbi:MAG: family transporter protein [Myxococcales bacterium]|nr:family transporter protein [Myxococcales bacterium]